MITVEGLTKSFGATHAVDDLSFVARPGAVTGFLGPNGSGKSTSMRCMLGLDRPERGTTTFDGKPYHSYAKPLHEVGALLDAGYVHPGRSGRNHLRWLAASNGISAKRVDEVLALVGLTIVGEPPRAHLLARHAPAARPGRRAARRPAHDHPRRAGQRPRPRGHPLDPRRAHPPRRAGPHRVRQQPPAVGDGVDGHGSGGHRPGPADRAVHGRPVRRPLGRPLGEGAQPAAGDVARALAAGGAHVAPAGEAALEVRGASIEDVGELAARNGWVLHELSPQTGSLEDAFLKATAHAQEYRSIPAPGPTPGAVPIAPPGAPT